VSTTSGYLGRIVRKGTFSPDIPYLQQYMCRSDSVMPGPLGGPVITSSSLANWYVVHALSYVPDDSGYQGYERKTY
jgi:hypothetical protein